MEYNLASMFGIAKWSNIKKATLLAFMLFFSLLSQAQNQYYLDFDGSNNYVRRVDNDTLQRMDGAANYTIEAWIYPIDGRVAEYDRVLQRHYSFAIVMYDGDNNGKVEDWYFQVYDKGSSSWKYYNTQGDATLTLDAWNHIAVINDASGGTLKLYVNGVDVTTSGGYSNRTMPSSSSNDDLFIGQKGNNTDYFGGYIDEVRIKKSAESISNIHFHIYDNEYTPDNNGNTAALFHFNEGTGSKTKEAVKNISADIYGGATWRKWNYKPNHILPLAKNEWTGNVSTDWSVGGNWSRDTLPSAESYVLIPDVTNDPLMDASNSGACNRMDLEASAILTVNGTLTVGDTFTNAGNFVVGGSFVNNGVYIDNESTKFNGSSAQTMPAAEYNKLEIDNSAGISLDGASSVKTSLTLTDGVITTTSANLLTLKNGCSLSGGSNTAYVDGPLTKIGSDDFVFPTGDAGRWARIGISNLSASETFTAEYTAATPNDNTNYSTPLTKVSDNEWWELDRTGSTVSADVSLYWEDSKWSGIGNMDSLRIARYNTSQWDIVSGSMSHTGIADLNSVQQGSISVSGVSDFGAFTFGTTDDTLNMLAVKLLNFSWNKGTKGIVLSWNTASESNNYGFWVQRSVDLCSWENTGFVLGCGNSNQLQKYTFIDYQPKSLNYYRLKIVNYNGDFEYSSILCASLKKAIQLLVYPNPAKRYINIKGINTKDIKEGFLISSGGRLMQLIDYNQSKIDISTLESGHYFILLFSKQGRQYKAGFIKE